MITEPSAVAPDAKGYSSYKIDVEASRFKVNFGIRRYGARFCNGALKRKEIEDPSQYQTNRHKLTKYLNSVNHAFSLGILCDNSKHYRRQGREGCHHQKMFHDFLPAEISKASSIHR